MLKKCLVCGREFNSPPSADVVTCSAECKKNRRSQLLRGHEVTSDTRKKISMAAKEQDRSKNLSKGTPAAMVSPKAGRFETNSSAKDWTILSPDGKIYNFVNLRNWIRQNLDKFGNHLSERDVDRINSGFRVAKRNMLRGTSTTTYKGWSVLYCGSSNKEKQKQGENKDDEDNVQEIPGNSSRC